MSKIQLDLNDFIALAISRIDRFIDMNTDDSEQIIPEWVDYNEIRLKTLDGVIEAIVAAKEEISNNRG